ncbi:MAG: enoyl-CoA hydratase-related protein [Acidimicrobiales bacterium]
MDTDADRTESLRYDRQGTVAVLTMNRPEKMNALSLDMMVRFADAWDAIEADPEIRCAILTGAGDAYCVGGDLARGWMGGDRADQTDHERRGAEDPNLMLSGLLVSRWLRKPLIAAVNGDCLGGGCEMLQSTDIRIAEEHARFGVPEARRGLIAGAGSTMRLKRQIPYAVAMEMLLTGRILDADEALRWGLVTHVVPKGTALTKAHEIADVIAANGPLAVASAKASAVETGWLPEDQASPIELGYAATVMFSKDAKEGMRAFAEKRSPEFTGE